MRVADLNIGFAEGMMVGDIEDRRTAKGFSVIKFRIVNRPSYNDKSGNERMRDPQTIEFQAFGDRGSGMVKGLDEGDYVRVQYELSGREYQGKFYSSPTAQQISRIHTAKSQRPTSNVVRPTQEVEMPEPDVPKHGTPPPDDEDLPF